MTSILFRIVRICCLQFKCNYFSTQKLFQILFFHVWNLHQILNILEKKMIVIATLFRKLETVKDFVTPLSKKHTFRALFYSQHVRGSQTLVKSAWDHFIIFFFFMTLRETDWEIFSLTDMLNLTGVSWHIEWLWEVSCSGLWEFLVPD